MVKDFPKIESPFKRDTVDKKYVIVPEFRREFEWMFDKEKVIASEKFDGTNTSVIVKDGKVQLIYNRTTQIPVLGNKSCHRFVEGINNSLSRGYFDTDKDGQQFGELLGPSVQGNPYDLEQHLWLPFDRIRKKYIYKFWYGLIDNGYTEPIAYFDDKSIYSNLSDLFKVLKSRYAISTGKDYFAEGIVFYNRETGEMCKLRRDMFDWFEGHSHKWKE